MPLVFDIDGRNSLPRTDPLHICIAHVYFSFVFELKGQPFLVYKLQHCFPK